MVNALFSKAAHTPAKPQNTPPLIHLPDFFKKIFSVAAKERKMRMKNY